jgi:hypothetical protein
MHVFIYLEASVQEMKPAFAKEVGSLIARKAVWYSIPTWWKCFVPDASWFSMKMSLTYMEQVQRPWRCHAEN